MTKYANGVRPTLTLAFDASEEVSGPREPEESRAATFTSRGPSKGFEQPIALAVVGEADRIFRELDALTSEVHGALYQARARLLHMLLEEVQARFAESLAGSHAGGEERKDPECLEAGQGRNSG